jgi:hypothetical protein
MRVRGTELMAFSKITPPKKKKNEKNGAASLKSEE